MWCLFIEVADFCSRSVSRVSAASAQAHSSRSSKPPIDAEALLHDRSNAASPEFEGRRTGTPGNARARAWIVERFREIGLVPPGDNFQMPFKFTRLSPELRARPCDRLRQGNRLRRGREHCRDLSRVRRRAQGSGASVMVITAHYDHLGVRDGVMYPGADDNASGVAVIARAGTSLRRARPGHTTRCLSPSTPKSGLAGRAGVCCGAADSEGAHRLERQSRHGQPECEARVVYRGNPPSSRAQAGARSRSRRARRSRCFSVTTSRRSRPAAPTTGRHSPITARFTLRGFRFVYFGVEDHADYHKPTDTADKIDPTFFAQVAATILDAMTALDRALPLR